MIHAKASTGKLDTTIRGWRVRMAPAARRQALEAAGLVVDHAAVIAPKDTNKYVRGWVQAGRQIGVGTMPMPRLTGSKYARSLVGVLQQQVEAAERRQKILRAQLAAWYTNKGRKPDKWSRRLQKRIERQSQRIEQARTTLNALLENPHATVIRRKVGYVLAGNDLDEGRATGISGTAINVEVRSKVYGGRGRILTLGTTTRIQLDVLEPYALSVERLRQVRSRAMAYARRRIKFRTGNARMFARLLDVVQ